MERYRNVSGNSGVKRYGIADDSITVEFEDGPTYVYDHKTTGARDVEEMKRLAIEGKGLSGYIARHVRTRYARQVR